jgi:hypothetical protein
MKVIATFARTTFQAPGKEPQVAEWRLKGGPQDIYGILGPKYRGDFAQRLLQHKRAEILNSNGSSVVWELVERQVEHQK